MINLLLADDCSVVDSVICPPPTMQPADLGDLLSLVGERLVTDGVLMLSGSWSRYVNDYAMQGGPQDAAVPLRAGDWSARVVQGDTWIRWTGPNRGDAIWTAEVDAIAPGSRDCPLIADNPIITASRMASWHQITGVPWVGTPGMAGNALLVDGWQKMNPKSAEPFWRSY